MTKSADQAQAAALSKSRKKPLETLGRLFKTLSSFRLTVILAIVLTMVSALTSIAGTWFLKPLINGFAEGLTPMDLLPSIIEMAMVFVVSALTSWLSALLMVQTSQQTTWRIRNQLFSHLQDLPLRYFDSKSHGELMSRFTNDIDNVSMALEQSLPQVISSAITVVGVFIMMLILSPLLTLVVLAMLGIILFALKYITGRSTKFFRQQQKSIGELNGQIEEIMIGQKVIKVFNHENQTRDEFAVKNEALRKTATSAQTYGGVMMPVMGNISYILYSLIAMGGAALAINGMLDIGSIAAFLTFTRSFTMPITNIANQLNMVLSALAGAERIFDVMDQPVETDTGTVTLVRTEDEAKEWAWKIPQDDGSFEIRPLRGDVRFDTVTFGYVPEKGVLKSVTLFAKPGQKIAFVGSTGAGKTTITNLINRFYEIQDGSITYDGVQISDIRKPDLRRAMGMVLQDVHLFRGTIRENIRYGKLDATDEEIVHAAKIANAHNFIMKLPDGYDTVLTADGDNLSQGQRQLLSIARARRRRPTSADSRRSYQLDRHPHRAPDRTRHGPAHARPDHLRHRPSPVHRPQRQRNHGAGKRRDHRTRRPRGSTGTTWKILSVVYWH